MSIGKRIKKLRSDLSISQSELAQKASISKQLLYKYENELITNIPSDKIEALAEALETTPGLLMGWDEIKLKDDFKLKISSDNLDALMVSAEWAALYMKLKDKPELYDQVINYANYLLKK